MTETTENKEVIYEFGKFRLDASERILTVDGAPMHLPAKEFDTLLLLVENNRKALSKEDMMVSIWHDVFVEESNLAKQVSRLRKVLTTNGTNYIETIPKHGYRFSADLRLTRPAIDQPVILEKRTVKRLTLAVENDAVETVRPRRTSSAFAVMTAVFLFALLGAVLWLSNSPASTSPREINSIAVLPLRPLISDESSKAIGLGLTDALITKIGSLKHVVVRPTGAVSGFGEAPENAVEIGKKLNVDAVLEGTLQQADGRLRVNARLIRTDTGEQLWAERFDEPSAGIFALQDALSTKIARTLALELTNSERSRLVGQGTVSVEAYEMFLRGRFYQTQNTPDGLNRSIELYQQAIALDPNFAQAYAGIADAKLIQYNFNFAAASDAIPEARQSIDRVMRLNPELSNAHTSLALVQFLAERNWPEAEKSLQRAITINPNNADAYSRYGYFLMRVGSFDEALEKYAKARELNPLSNIVQSGIGLTYLCARRYPEAIDQLERTAAENPKFSHPRWLLATAYEAAGNPEKAFEENLKALAVEGGNDFAAVLERKRDVQGIDAANRLWLEESVRRQTTNPVSSLFVAMRAATVKDSEATLFWLEKSFAQGETTLGGIRYLSKFDFVRDEIRFNAIIAELAY